MVPMMIGVGIGVDYALQQQERDQLNGIADAAVLVPLTPSLMQQPQIVAQLAAQNFWNTQSVTVRNATGVSGLVNVTDVVSGSSLTRQVSLSWSGTSTNSFSSLVGLKTLPLSGSSQAASGLAPAINFYLMVDTSPSMGIVSTAQGIQTMVNATPSQGGCAFACHEQYPANDKLGNPLGEDNYALARNLGLTLRLDVVNYAVSSMIKSAATTALTNNTKYGVSVSTIDYQVGQVYQTGDVSSNMVAATSATANIQQLEVAYENCLSASNCNAYGAGNDQDSFLDLGLSTLNTTNLGTYNVSTGPGYRLYKPGYGTKNPGDSPQEVVFIITDGVVDESYNGGRAMAPVNTLVDNCSKIKSSGVRVAFLYLTYNTASHK